MLEKILQASAGTGKTHQIVNLGLEPANGGRDFSCLRRTVFLSFSNAAAEEIKARLYEKTAPRSAASFGEALGTSEARVYTVHSFCFELARIFRYELGLPADARFPTDENAGIWGDCVADFFRSHWDLGSLSAQLGFKDGSAEYELLKILYLLGDRKALRDFITAHGQKVFFLGEVLGAGTAMPETAPKEDLEALGGRLALARLVDEDENPDLDAAIGKIIPLLLQTRPVLERIVTHIGRHVYLPYMYERGIFDFDSLVYFVVKILRDMKAQEGMDAFLRRLEEDGFGFDRLFVDEAQDCDILMNNFIGYFLGDKCKVAVSIVGDAKQSIYRWRNAYPEEFLKMCSEAETLGKRKSLLASYRIKNQNTLAFINGLVKKVALEYKGEFRKADGTVSEESFFDYNQSADELEKPEDKDGKKWMESVEELKVGYAVINEDRVAAKEAIEDFINRTPGRTGVIFRSRGDFWKSKLPLMLGDKLQYRLAEPFEETREHGDKGKAFSAEEISDIDPDYYLLKTLLWFFTAADRDKAAASLLLTREGLELARRLWPEHVNESSVSGPAGFVRAAAAVYSEIQALYYGGPETTVTEKLYALLDKRSLWPVFFRPECLLSPERAARALNHALGGLYLYETGGEGRSEGGAGLLAALAAAKIPYESSIAYDVDQKGLSYAEAVTIHSSKGLTYDKVILILKSDDLLKAEADGRKNKEEFSNLFHAEFEKVAGPVQRIKLDYFPYLGPLTSGRIREGGKLYPGVDKLYNETLKRVKAENANLFYVGVTRTKEQLMFLDIGKPAGGKTPSGKKSAAKPPMLGGFIESLMAAGKISKSIVPAGPAEWGSRGRRTMAGRARLELDGAFRLVGVRTDIKDSGEIPAAPKISACAARLLSGDSLNMYVGVRVHQLVDELMLKAPAADGYESVVRASPVAALDEAGRRAAEVLLRPENRALLQPLFKAGVKNLPELRVWGLSSDGRRLLNGVIDGVLVDKADITVLEYKTLFKSSAAQVALGEKQKDRYVMMLDRIKGGRGIKGEVIGIKAG